LVTEIPVRAVIEASGTNERARVNSGHRARRHRASSPITRRTRVRVPPGARQIGLEVRVGIHTGEVERRGTELAGIAAHLAHRVCDAADPGEVLVTRTVPDLVAGSGIVFDDRGERDLKGIPVRWRLFAVTA
jgi:class 3 adenylate cyclase